MVFGRYSASPLFAQSNRPASAFERAVTGKQGYHSCYFESNRQRVPLALAPTRGIRQSSAASDRRELITASSVKTSLAFEVREPAFDTPTRPFPFASRHAKFRNQPR